MLPQSLAPGRRRVPFLARAKFGALLLGVLLIGWPTSSPAQGTLGAEPSASLESLTFALLGLNAQYQRAAGAERVKLGAALRRAAATRRELLAEIIESEPGAVLRNAVPGDVRASLPRGARRNVEQEVEADGEIEVAVEDADTWSRLHYTLITAQRRRLSLHFAGDPPQLETGMHIHVRAIRIGQALALDADASSSTGFETLALALPNTFGAQRTVVLLVNFQDKSTQPYTLDYARGVVFTTTSDFYREGSYGQTWLTGNVYGWYTIPLDSTGCDIGKIASYAKAAATAAGVDLSGYTRYVYAFPANACTWWGWGMIGGVPSQAWIKGSFQLGVVGHELGHNFGLYHAHAFECGTVTIGGSCSSIEYGDTVDIMGASYWAHFNAFMKERLGWLAWGSSPPITTVQAGGTYTLDPYESVSSGPKALKILKSVDPTTGKQTWYYVEYRQPLGFDGPLASNANVLDGVVIRTGTDSSGNSSYLLDMTPATASWSDPALVVGATFYDPDSGVTITPLSASGSGAAVNVSFGPLACTPAPPSVALAPSDSQWLQPGMTVTYTVSLTNNDNAGCTASEFDLGTTLPTGWTAVFAASRLTLAPGATGLTTLEVTSPVSAPDGQYRIDVTATNSANTALTSSTSVTCVLVSALEVTVTTDRASYTRKQAVSITTLAGFADGSAAANADVLLRIAKPDGTVVQQSVRTDASGVALYNLRLKPRDPLGTYQVSAEATLGVGPAGSATTSFTVR